MPNATRSRHRRTGPGEQVGARGRCEPHQTALNGTELRRTDGVDLDHLVFALATAVQRPRSHKSRQLHRIYFNGALSFLMAESRGLRW
jgi:hypothetical protein